MIFLSMMAILSLQKAADRCFLFSAHYAVDLSNITELPKKLLIMFPVFSPLSKNLFFVTYRSFTILGSYTTITEALNLNSTNAFGILSFPNMDSQQSSRGPLSNFFLSQSAFLSSKPFRRSGKGMEIIGIPWLL